MLYQTKPKWFSSLTLLVTFTRKVKWSSRPSAHCGTPHHLQGKRWYLGIPGLAFGAGFQWTRSAVAPGGSLAHLRAQLLYALRLRGLREQSLQRHDGCPWEKGSGRQLQGPATLCGGQDLRCGKGRQLCLHGPCGWQCLQGTGTLPSSILMVLICYSPVNDLSAKYLASFFSYNIKLHLQICMWQVASMNKSKNLGV